MTSGSLKTNRAAEFIILTVMIALTRLFDLGTTYLITPDLGFEMNSFVAVFGMGWAGFLAAQALLCLLVIWASYYSLFVMEMTYPLEKGLDFNDFQMFYMFGKSIQEKNPLVKFIKILKLNLPFIGYLLPRLLILSSFFIGMIHALFLFHVRPPIKSVFVLYIVLVIGVLALEKVYAYRNFRIYKRMDYKP